MLIIKSQLSNDVKSIKKFSKKKKKKIRIPLFMLYSTFFCGCHMNQRLAILRDFAEVCIEFRSFLQSLLLRESTKKGRLNFRVSLWERKFKDIETRRSLFYNFFLHQKSNATDQN